MRAENLKIVFDKYPPSAVGKYQLTLNQSYPAKLINSELGLYQLVDDVGTTFNVSTYGAGYSNGGYWHTVEG